MRGRRAAVQLACRTPLAVRDRDETCLDVTVEHGSCVEVLVLLFKHDADASCAAREGACFVFALGTVLTTI